MGGKKKHARQDEGVDGVREKGEGEYGGSGVGFRCQFV